MKHKRNWSTVPLRCGKHMFSLLSFVHHKISPPGHRIVCEYNLPNLITLDNLCVSLFGKLRNNMATLCECEAVQ